MTHVTDSLRSSTDSSGLLTKHLQNCGHCTDPPVDFPLHVSPTRKQDLEVFELLYLGQDLLSDLEKALHLFPAENNAVRFGSADSNPSCFTFGREPIQGEL